MVSVFVPATCVVAAALVGPGTSVVTTCAVLTSDAGTSLVNTAHVVTTEVPGPTNAAATTQVAGTKTLTITKTQTSGPNPATAQGQVLGYTIVVHNTGTTTQTGV